VLFIVFVPLGGLCFLLSLFVLEVGLRQDQPKAGESNSDVSVAALAESNEGENNKLGCEKRASEV
jgi:hypothetical protein